MKLYRLVLLLLLAGAVLAGLTRLPDLLAREPVQASLGPSSEPQVAPTEQSLPIEALPLPALPRPGSADPLVEQAQVIPPLAPRPGAFTSRTLPPEKLKIPSIDLDARVIPLGTHYDRAGALVWETAPFAVGHHRGSANPGEGGNVVLSGHISSPSEGSIFQRLPQLRPGDNFIISTAQASFVYRVSDVQVVAPTAVEFLESTSASTATLITCYPDRIYSHRLIVRAQAV
jgi:sortase A